MGLDFLRYYADDICEGELSVRDYSGRGMFGAKCPGISTEGSALALYHDMVVALVGEEDDTFDPETVLEELGTPCSDSLGMGQILYFPECEWEDTEEE